MAETWQSWLQPGETLLWQGAPLPGVHGWGKIIGMALFGLPFQIAGVTFLLVGLWQMADATKLGDIGLGLFFTVFSLPFAAVGVFLVFGQAYAAKTAHRATCYALSNRAAYIAKSGRTHSLESYPILRETALGLEKHRHADTVWFHVRTEKDSDGDRSTTRISFDNIAEGDEVYRLLRSIQIGTT
jgi:hypothetical protein